MSSYNPSFVVVSCPKVQHAFGFMPGEAVATTQKHIYKPDANGLQICVHSPKYNRSIQLLPGEYEVLHLAPQHMARKVISDLDRRLSLMHEDLDFIYSGGDAIAEAYR